MNMEGKLFSILLDLEMVENGLKIDQSVNHVLKLPFKREECMEVSFFFNLHVKHVKMSYKSNVHNGVSAYPTCMEYRSCDKPCRVGIEYCGV